MPCGVLRCPHAGPRMSSGTCVCPPAFSQSSCLRHPRHSLPGFRADEAFVEELEGPRPPHLPATACVLWAWLARSHLLALDRPRLEGVPSSTQGSFGPSWMWFRGTASQGDSASTTARLTPSVPILTSGGRPCHRNTQPAANISVRPGSEAAKALSSQAPHSCPSPKPQAQLAARFLAEPPLCRAESARPFRLQ